VVSGTRCCIAEAVTGCCFCCYGCRHRSLIAEREQAGTGNGEIGDGQFTAAETIEATTAGQSGTGQDDSGRAEAGSGSAGQANRFDHGRLHNVRLLPACSGLGGPSPSDGQLCGAVVRPAIVFP